MCRQGRVNQAMGRMQRTRLRVHTTPGGLSGLLVEQVLLLVGRELLPVHLWSRALGD